MSDGLPYHYLDDATNTVVEDDENDTSMSQSEAIKAAKLIKDKGAKLYTVGFDMENDSNAVDLMKTLASSNGTYYNAADGKKLSQAFKDISETITTTTDGTPISLTTTNGVVTIAEGFENGQNVEIYTNSYGPNATPTYTYNWDKFIDLSEVDYTNNLITFNLREFMKQHNISEDTNITIRFVYQNKETDGNTFNIVLDAIENNNINSKTLPEVEEQINDVDTNKAKKPEKTTNNKSESKPVEEPIQDTDKTNKPVLENTDKQNSNETTTAQEEKPTTEETPIEQPTTTEQQTNTEQSTETENIKQDTASNINENSVESNIKN